MAATQTLAFSSPAAEAHFAAVATRCDARLVAAAKAEALAHADFFGATESCPELEQAAANRYGHNLANIGCGWITTAEPRYLADYLPAEEATSQSAAIEEAQAFHAHEMGDDNDGRQERAWLAWLRNCERIYFGRALPQAESGFDQDGNEAGYSLDEMHCRWVQNLSPLDAVSTLPQAAERSQAAASLRYMTPHMVARSAISADHALANLKAVMRPAELGKAEDIAEAFHEIAKLQFCDKANPQAIYTRADGGNFQLEGTAESQLFTIWRLDTDLQRAAPCAEFRARNLYGREEYLRNAGYQLLTDC